MTEKKIKITTIIKGCILAIGIIAMLSIWPLGIITNMDFSSTGGENNQRTGAIFEGVNVLQEFVPQYDYIESIGILINKQDSKVSGGDLQLVFANGDFTQCVEVTVPISQMEESSYYDIPIQEKVTKGATYYYSITTVSTGVNTVSTEEVAPLLIYRRLNTAGPAENRKLYYNGNLIENGSLACRYSYRTPLTVAQIATYDAFLILVVMLLWMIVDKVTKGKIQLKKISLGKTERVVGTVCTTIGMAACFYYLLIRRVFGDNKWDLRIFFLGILFSWLIANVIIWSKGTPKSISEPTKNNISLKKIVQKIPEGIQIGAFAFYFIRYAYYFNSGVNYGHDIGTAYMNIAFGIIVLTLFSRKEIFSIPNLIFTIIYGVSFGRWIGIHNFDIDTRTLYLLEIVAGWIWGMVLIRTILNLVHKKLRKFSIPYTLLVAGFFALLIIFRNTRQWPVLLVSMFVLFYLQKLDDGKIQWLFRNLCHGAILSFFYFVFQSLLFRPYHDIRYSRYPGAFSSVAIWGIYLMFIFCAVFVTLMVEFKKNNKLKHMSFYYVTIGICLSYIFMSVSRTALFGIVVMLLIMIPILGVLWFRGNLKKLATCMGFVLLTLMLLFPGVYTATRCIPAIVNQPLLLPYEEFEGSILVGEKKDSKLYMTFDHFLELSVSKLWTTFEKTEITTKEVSSTEDVSSNQEVADIQLVPLSAQVDEKDYNDASGGRLAIFKHYIERLNWTGHDAMIITVNNEIIAHAHNTFLQSAYDHGIATGIVFVLFGIC
ncbi:MAG TPA: O-antigen polymerase, partial [Lachnospiraceae bacterium]|nr:O-antigen polymerase [Lachnospiraceae bacterium]